MAMQIVSIAVKGDQDRTYTVDVNPEGALRCTCHDFFYRGEERPCKHIVFAREAVRTPATA